MAGTKVKKIDMRESIKAMAVKSGLTIEAVVSALKDAFAAGWKVDHRKDDRYHVAKSGKVRYKNNEFYLDKNGHIISIIICKVVSYEDKEFDDEYTPMVAPRLNSNQSVKEPIRHLGDIYEDNADAGNFTINARKEFEKILKDRLRLSLNDNLLTYYQEKVDTLITANVTEVSPRGLKISLGNDVESYVPFKSLFLRDHYYVGDKIKVLVTGVTKEERGIKVTTTRNDNRIIEALYEDEYTGTKDVVEFYKVAFEELGYDDNNKFVFGKCKVCVRRKDPNVDPVSSLIGQNGDRSKRISNVLGLQVEIFEYSDNIQTLIGRALAPAKAERIIGINEKEKKARVIVKDEQYSLAIGKGGINARLAVSITGWGIDIKSETDAIAEGLIF
ncbi:MAG: S1 RNA-binding domain-containing protein [Acholeplasmatales bacterium]|jgi:N utilization substance protein A|nr:S1 RNA-binding domain-containing protein [Acholeplasmatales bacterium]